MLQQLRAELDALSLALRKANDLVARAAESPDTVRRRRNSLKRWHEVYASAHERLLAHTREHQCATSFDASAS